MTLRRQPLDFQVQERPAPAYVASLGRAWATGTPHAVYELTKTSLTTPDAANFLARDLSRLEGGPGTRLQVEYAGLKDKHAVTRQLVSIGLGEKLGEKLGRTLPTRIEGISWWAELKGFAARALSSSDIEGNTFTLVVRDLTRKSANQMSRHADALTLGDAHEPGLVPPREHEAGHASRTLIITNYFGAQRFGSARHGKGFVATHLVRGDFEQALKLAIATPARKDVGKLRTFTRLAAGHWGDWSMLARDLPSLPERRPIEALARGASFQQAFTQLPSFLQAMYLEAFQSHVWNRAAAAMTRALCSSSGGASLFTASDDFGEMVFARAASVVSDLRTVDMPVLAPSTELREPWGPFADRALRDEGLALADLRVPGLRRPFFGEAPRPLFARVERFRLGAVEPDELATSAKRLKREAAFDLPRGAYATVVMRALGQ
ncbi:MAG: tRNA pseudouridine(13) synthase TruD [Planctomycetota bacterium]|nr:tRNA pseudouridine(13) synthase TruD [Planctomycetota bacterium]